MAHTYSYKRLILLSPWRYQPCPEITSSTIQPFQTFHVVLPILEWEVYIHALQLSGQRPSYCLQMELLFECRILFMSKSNKYMQQNVFLILVTYSMGVHDIVF